MTQHTDASILDAMMKAASDAAATVGRLSKTLYIHGLRLLRIIIGELLAISGLLMVTAQSLLRWIDDLLGRLARHPVFDAIETWWNVAGRKLLSLITRIRQHPLYRRLGYYALLIRLDKPIGILLLLWPTLIALWLAAGGWPDPLVLTVFVLGVIMMRSAGCAINDYADRHIDGQVKRTRQRPLAAGKISEKEALAVFSALGLASFALVLLMNELTIMMSFVGIALAASYPFMKRYHYLPQVHLGAAFGWAVPMAYAAQAGEVDQITWLLFLATVLWATVYDTMYAMVDYDDDIRIGVKSTAILFGNQDKRIIAILQVLLICNLVLIGRRAEMSGFYYLGLTAATLLAGYQQYLIRNRVREDCFKAFLNNNWFGLVLFLGVVLDLHFADLR